MGAGDLWYFPAGLPHSIQGIGDDGAEFLLVFNDGLFSEGDTFLLSETLAHTPPEIVSKNMGWSRQAFDKLPETQLYIFEAPLPGSLEDDRRFLGEHLGTGTEYTFKLASMALTQKTAGGEVRIGASVASPGTPPPGTTFAQKKTRLRPCPHHIPNRVEHPAQIVLPLRSVLAAKQQIRQHKRPFLVRDITRIRSTPLLAILPCSTNKVVPAKVLAKYKVPHNL